MRDAARTLAAPVGAVLEGGYDLDGARRQRRCTLAALGGDGEAESIAPDPLITSRAAAHVSHFWEL